MSKSPESPQDGLSVKTLMRLLRVASPYSALVLVIAVAKEIVRLDAGVTLLILWWLLAGIDVCWTGRSLVHVLAGYLWCKPKNARRRMWGWLALELAVSAALAWAAGAVGRAGPMSLWLLVDLVIIAVALSAIPLRQAADVAEFDLPSGGDWMGEHLGGWFGEGSDAPIPVLFRAFTSKVPQLVVGNLARVLGVAAFMAVVIATIEAFTPDHRLEVTPPPGISLPVIKPPAHPTADPASLPFVIFPPVVPVPEYPGDTTLTYQQLCGATKGGPVPGASANEWARAGLKDLVLGPLPHGYGGYVSGCLGVVSEFSDSSGTTAWAEGYLNGRLMSVALYSTVGGGCLVRDSAAQPVADLLNKKIAVSCTGRQPFGPAGDAYLITTRYGTFAFLRSQLSAGGGIPQPYLELSPGVSDGWAEAERLAGVPLLVAAPVGNTYPLVTLQGGPTPYAISISHGAVRLKTDKGSHVVKARAALSWTTTISQ